MTEHTPNPAHAYHGDKTEIPASYVGLPIKEDTAVQVGLDRNGQPEIQQVKQIYRPPEKLSKPIKPRWRWIWLAIIIIYIIVWAFLFHYFSTHQAPFAAPISR